jgi:hypothetical protein
MDQWKRLSAFWVRDGRHAHNMYIGLTQNGGFVQQDFVLSRILREALSGQQASVGGSVAEDR